MSFNFVATVTICSDFGVQKNSLSLFPLHHHLFVMNLLYLFLYMHAKLLQLCPTLCDTMDCSQPGSSVHGILQTRILEWVVCPPPGDLPNPGIQPAHLLSPALPGGFFTTSSTQEAPYIYICVYVCIYIHTHTHNM